MPFMFWVVVGGIALAIGVTMTLMAIPTYNQTLSLDILGIILGVIGIGIGIGIAYRQNKQVSDMDDIINDIRRYSEKTDNLQNAQMLATLLTIYPLLKSNRDVLQEQFEMITIQIQDETERLAYMSRTFHPKSDFARVVSDTSDKIIIALISFEPIMNDEMYTAVYDYAQRTAILGNPNPENMEFTSLLLHQWISECEQVIGELDGLLPELKSYRINDEI